MVPAPQQAVNIHKRIWPMRQWVLSVPFPLRFLFASNPKVMTRVLGIVYRSIAKHRAHKAGFTYAELRIKPLLVPGPRTNTAPICLSDRFALTTSSYSMAASWILQILTFPGASKIFHKIRTPPPRDHPALPGRPGVLARVPGRTGQPRQVPTSLYHAGI